MQKKFILILFILTMNIIPSVSAIRPHYIYDNANTVDSSWETKINEFGVIVDKATTVEIVIVTLQTLPTGKSVDEIKLAYLNDIPLDGVKGVGKTGKDNGVLILLVIDSHDWAIETGYGVEGVLTDAECGRIGRDIMTPKFQSSKFGEGLYLGMHAIATKIGYIVTTSGTTTTASTSDFFVDNLWLIIVIGIVIIVIIILIVPFINDGGGYSGRSYSSGGGGSGGGFGGGGSGGGGGGGKWNIPPPIIVPLVGVAAFLAGQKTLSELIPDGTYKCPKCEKETAYAKDSERTFEELQKDGVYRNTKASYLCLVCGSVYPALLSSVLIENLDDYKQRIVREEEEAEEMAKRRREEEARARVRRESERKRQDDDRHSSYNSGSSHSGGSSFGGGSSGGGGARGKW